MSNTLSEECGRLEALNRELLEALRKARETLWHMRYNEAMRWGTSHERAHSFATHNQDVTDIDKALAKAEKGG